MRVPWKCLSRPQHRAWLALVFVTSLTAGAALGQTGQPPRRRPPQAPPLPRSEQATPQSQPANPQQAAAERLKADMEFVMDTVNKAQKDDAPLRFKNDLDQAVQICRSIRREHPGYVLATLMLAEALRLLNRGSEAVDFYSEVLGMPQVEYYYVAHKGLGKIYADAQWYQLALAELEKAAALKTGDPDVYRDIARCYESKNELKKAIENAQYAVGAAPDDPALHTLLSRLNATSGDFVTAWGEAQRAMVLAYDKFAKDPTDVVAITLMLQYSRFNMDILNEYLDYKSHNPDYGANAVELIVRRAKIWREVSILAQLLSLHEALRWANDMNKVYPDDPRLLLEIAKFQQQVQMDDDAKKTLQRVLEISPGNVEAKQILEFLQNRGGRTTPLDAQNDVPVPERPDAAESPPATSAPSE